MSVRSLADALRATDDQRLAALLRARPDLLSPVPVDLGQLAARASSAPAVARLMDHLDRWTLDVLEAACVPERPDRLAVAALLPGADGVRVDVTLDRLLDLALMWEDDDGVLHVVVGAREVVGPAPAGLGPPLAVALSSLPAERLDALLADLGLPGGAPLDERAALDQLVAHLSGAETLDALLASAPSSARELLDQLTWGPPVGRVPRADRVVRTDEAASPVEWLLAHGLLAPADRTTVVLPREVALHLRGGTTVADPRPDPPRPEVAATVEVERADRTAAAQAFGFVRLVDDLLDAWGVDPPAVLRAGGLGVRELRRAADRLEVEEWEAALAAEVARAAGLVAASGSFDQEWLPTTAYDRWRLDTTEDRWTALARAWLGATRLYGLVGARDERDRALSALGPDLDRLSAPELRRTVLEVLAALPTGAVPTVEGVDVAVAWRRPRRSPRLRHDVVGWTLREAERLGVTGAGALSSAGRAAVAGDDALAAATLGPLLPQPLDYVLLQADLTAVAPGPLVTDLAHSLGLAADVESRGGATVYRFSESSVRRALDAGRSASDLHAMLAAHSRTPVPQPLTYLVDDVARRHGAIRVGAAGAYVRCDDPAVVDELVAQRRAAPLGLRRLAPTVAVAQARADDVLDRLRELGYAPAAESPDGVVLVRRPDARRAAAPAQPPSRGQHAPPGEVLVAAAVRALRAGDRASRAPRGEVVAGMAAAGDRASTAVLPRTAATRTIDLLRTALAEGRPVWIGYVDTHGGVSERVVDPVRLEGGVLTAYDHRLEQVRTFPLHRVTGVADLDD